MKMKGFIKRAFSAIILSLSLVSMSACGGTQSTSVDYVSKVKFSQADWKTTEFLTTGTGVVTLKHAVDGDTAHFFTGPYNKVIQGRFNGVNTPESTGVIEEWGKAASNYTKQRLEESKTIVLETERADGIQAPEADSTAGRYLVWVWVSDKPVEEEDGTGLRLLNLELVQYGYSRSQGTAGSKYEDTFLDADAQAQAQKIHIWSDEDDPLFYYGGAEITNMQAVFSNPADWLGRKVYVEGVVTRRLGTNAYIQDDFEQEDGTIKTYGAYIFTQYKEYSILKIGNRIGVIGIISEHYGSYQIVDVKYNAYLPTDDDMKLLSSDNVIEPKEISVEEALKGEDMSVLVRLRNLKATGGYGGLDELDQSGQPNEKNSMTIDVVDENGKSFNIRLDSEVYIKGQDGTRIRSYKYFVEYCKQGNGYTFDFVGLIGKYENQMTGHEELQLMLVGTSDLYYNAPEA